MSIKRKASHYRASKSAVAEPGDEAIGDYSLDRLIQMNARFVERVERAIERGLERRPDGEAPAPERAA
jgi:hypothetical protein